MTSSGAGVAVLAKDVFEAAKLIYQKRERDNLWFMAVMLTYCAAP